jgi:hypothetical protein
MDVRFGWAILRLIIEKAFFSREAWREFSDYDLEGSRGAPGGTGGACRSHPFRCNFNVQRY